jgi:hypothetical protein
MKAVSEKEIAKRLRQNQKESFERFVTEDDKYLNYLRRQLYDDAEMNRRIVENFQSELLQAIRADRELFDNALKDMEEEYGTECDV